VGGAVGAFALMFGGQSAMAESNGVVQRTDPKANSPAGVIYQIPLDSGRRDAAPVLPLGSRPGGGSGGSTTGGSDAGSGSGSSGTGSGTSSAGAGGAQRASIAAPAGGGTQRASATASRDGATPSNPSSIHSENGFGSSSQVPGVSRAALLTGAGVPAASTPGSTLPSYLLMALIGVAAVAVGLLASRSTRRRGAGGRGNGGPPPAAGV
jgi:hypothetical protein